MRIRSLKPGFFTNEELAELPFEARLLFQGLWCLSDSHGRFEWRPKRIKAEIFPYDDKGSDGEVLDTSQLLHSLSLLGFIFKYVVNGVEYGCIPTFRKHQNLSGKEFKAAPKFPSPQGGTTSEDNGNFPDTSQLLQEQGVRSKEQGVILESGDSTPVSSFSESEVTDLCTLEEWLKFAESIGYDLDDARRAYNNYSRDGWTRDGKRKGERIPIKNWKAACRTCFDLWKKWKGKPNQQLFKSSGQTTGVVDADNIEEAMFSKFISGGAA